jgi:hypothetical protein
MKKIPGDIQHLIVIAVAGILAFISLSCGCDEVGFFDRGLRSADVAIRGKVITSTRSDEYSFTATFLVLKSYKGKTTKDTITVITEAVSSCRMYFTPGEEFLVFGYGERKDLIMSLDTTYPTGSDTYYTTQCASKGWDNRYDERFKSVK